MSTAQMTRTSQRFPQPSPSSDRRPRQANGHPSIRPGGNPAPAASARPASARPDSAVSAPPAPPANPSDRAELPILFQTFIKTASGARTYAAQLKETKRGDHFLVLTDGHRDAKTDELRKSRLFIFSEDFVAFFRLLQETAQFIKANPVPEDVKRRRQKFPANSGSGNRPAAPAADNAPNRAPARR